MDINGMIAITEIEHQIQAKLFGMNDIVEDKDGCGQAKNEGRPLPPIIKFFGYFTQPILVIRQERKESKGARNGPEKTNEETNQSGVGVIHEISVVESL